MVIQQKLLLVLGMVALICLSVAILASGSPINDVNLLHQILFRIRIPHALSAFVAGGLLALAGAIMQVLVRNPLADPYVLGLSGGAAVATLICMLCHIGGFWLTGGAWLGCLLTMLMLLFLTRRQRPWQPTQFLLTGIALASGASALVSLLFITSPDKTLRSMFFWLIGDLSDAYIPYFETVVLLVALACVLTSAKSLNILIRGDKQAQSLGIHVKREQLKLFLLSSLLTATAVTMAGCIGFVGLIVPHIFRLLFGSDHRLLLPGCVLLGGSLLTLADFFARTLFFPLELPVGIIMDLIGIPIFLFLLQKNST